MIFVFEVLAIFIFLYIFVVFILSQFVVPRLRKIQAPSTIGQELRSVVREISAKAINDWDFIQKVLDRLKKHFYVKPHQSFLSPWILFRRDVDATWQRRGNQACTVLNLILKTILLKSGRFQEHDIKERLCVFQLGIHQYLEIKFKDGRIIKVDPWGYLSKRTRLGQAAYGFFHS